MSEHPKSGSDTGPPTVTENPHWKKKIIVCCDGTGQRYSPPFSNVQRIHTCIEGFDNSVPQVKHYEPGIGTGKWKLLGLLQQATGAGIDQSIQNVYRFICEQYDDEHSMICLIGYSRGAYTARCVAQFIEDAGLLLQRSIQQLPDVFSLWTKKGQEVRHEPLVRENSRPGVRIQACAVWDTVSSLCLPMPAPIPQPRAKYMDLVNSRLSHNIDQAFQALALHERRRHFLPVVWKYDTAAPPISDPLQQCWFAGYHCDIGGGRKEEFLAHIALIWMMARLSTLLNFDRKKLCEENPRTLSWKVPNEVKKYGSKNSLWTIFKSKVSLLNSKVGQIPIKDSLSGIFRIGGSKGRRPRCHFWEPGFLETQPGTDNSKEKIHLTVDAMLSKDFIAPCAPLGSAQRPSQTDRNAQRPIWHLQWSTNGIETPYPVPEDSVAIREREWLQDWVKEEHEMLGRSFPLNAGHPRTLIPILRHILDLL